MLKLKETEMYIIQSEEFIKAVSHFVEMCMADVQWSKRYDTKTPGKLAANSLVDCIDEHFENQSVAYKKRIDLLEEALQNILYGMEASGGWEGDEELFSAGMNALKP